MCQVDICVPEEFADEFKGQSDMTPHDYFAEMSPLFCNMEIPFDSFGQRMQEHVEKHNLSKKPRRLLVGGMKATEILIATPLLKWYILHGMQVTKIHEVVEFQAQACFKNFAQEVSEARRQGDQNPDMAIIGETRKLIGNSSYGSLIMDKTRHRHIKYVQGETPTCLLVNKAQFRKLECIQEETDYYEVELSKDKIRLDLPIQLGYMILQYAKLRMLEFYYDFMEVYIDRSRFELMETDTDSIYTAISGSCLSDVIKPSMKEKYQHGLTGFCDRQDVEADNTVHWFPRYCCDMYAKYDKRIPGLFKLEFEGDEMIGLCSKSYIVSNSEESREENRVKLSCKGVNKNTIVNPLDVFRSVLQTGQSKSSINRGFRPKNSTIFTYRQEKIGWNYFYIKRKVRADGIHTDPLDITLCPVSKEEEEQQKKETH